jgi:hypothetical protein
MDNWWLYTPIMGGDVHTQYLSTTRSQLYYLFQENNKNKMMENTRLKPARHLYCPIDKLVQI